MTATALDLGAEYVRLVAAKDHAGLQQLLADDVDFRALTPRKAWELHDAKDAVQNAIGVWFDEDDDIQELLAYEVRPVAGSRSSLSYRLRVRNADGDHIVEQQAYFECDGAHITWMRVLCAGYLPA